VTVDAQTRSALQQRVATAIVHAAARVFAGDSQQSNMNAVAEVAGVSRATLYRYFPSRQALLAELAEVALVQVGERLDEARVDDVAVEEGIRRAARALVDVGDYFTVLARERALAESSRWEQTVALPLRRLLERGQQTGVIRQDVPSSWLTDLFMGQVVSTLSAQPRLGNDDAIAAVAGLFVDGARAR
jgi:TetR/AcrR family transcriptional repressor of mexCD-oprJ operon